MNGIEIIDHIVDYINAYVWQGIPGVLKGLILSLIFVVIFRQKIKKHPIAFYIYPVLFFLWDIVACISFLSPSASEKMISDAWKWVLIVGWWLDWLGFGVTFGIGLIIIVMFIGVLPKTALVKNLYTIRTEMSIIGATILVGHGILQLDNIVYFKKFYGFSVYHFLLFYVLGLGILALLIIPWITSFRNVRKKMNAHTWKKLQAYLGVPLFLGMLVFGLVMYLGRIIMWYPGIVVDAWDVGTWNATHEDPLSLSSAVAFENYILTAKIYMALLVSYIVLRIKKVRKGNRSGANLPVETSEAAG
jgi:DMSO/TMAO reductase YedYZ heme-binding membrane subunit